jgi:multiple sugar transport system ATP-binding protein
MIALKLENLSKRFGKKVWGVKKLDLHVEEREFVVLLGPSGCGKTTTLRMVAGLEEVTTGTISLFDRDITEIAPRKRNVSMVFQSYAVWPHMTVFDNIAFALKLRKLGKQEIEKTVGEVADMVKIGELLERYPKQLSGGQRQRVALARALAVHPQLFLMDEPLSNLDAKLRVVMRTELKAIHQKTGATTIFVTHDQSEAMSMADRIVIMKDGEVVQSGSPDDVYRRSADMFVAGFIGTPPTNFFEVGLRRENGSLRLEGPHFQIDMTGDNLRMLKSYDKEKLTLGVRPEDILIVGENEGFVSKDILVVEPQGSHKIVAIELGTEVVKIVASPELPVAPGDIVHLKFNESALSFYDSETQSRITG